MLTIRPATPDDIPEILAFIRELAEYEREPQSAVATHDDLLRDGFGLDKRFHCLIAEWEGQTRRLRAVLLQLLHLARPRRHLSGRLIRRPEFRGKGIGKALFAEVAAIAVAEGCPRLEWAVLDWNHARHRLLQLPRRHPHVRVDDHARLRRRSATARTPRSVLAAATRLPADPLPGRSEFIRVISRKTLYQ